MIDIFIQGLMLGGLYALFALGQSLMFGVMRLTNTAQGDFIILGGFSAISLAAATGLSPGLTLLMMAPAAFVFGYLLQRFVLNGTLGRDPLPSLVVTFGLAIIIQNLLLEVYSADPRSLDAGPIALASVSFGESTVGTLPLLTFGVALAATIGLQSLFSFTPLGRSFRAVSDDREAAQLMGIRPAIVYAQATGLAFVLIAIAGALQAMRTTVSPADGPLLLLFAFEAVIIGGMGSFWGTLLGALLLGLAQQIGFRFDPGWGIWFGHLTFLFVLLVRPQGLFPKTR